MDKIPPKTQYIMRKVGQNFERAITESMSRRAQPRKGQRGNYGDMELRKDMFQGGTGPRCRLHLNLQGRGELKLLEHNHEIYYFNKSKVCT